MAGLPGRTLRVLVRLAAGGQEPAVQAKEFRTAGVIVFLQPVGEHEPAALNGGFIHDTVE